MNGSPKQPGRTSDDAESPAGKGRAVVAAPPRPPLPAGAAGGAGSVPRPSPAGVLGATAPVAAGTDAAAAQAGRASSRSTMEFLEELEVPARPISQELDVARVPGLADALARADDPDHARDRLSIPSSPADDDLSAVPIRGMSLPPFDATGASAGEAVDAAPPVAKSAAELLAERRLRLTIRIHTCRDAFRMLGYLGIDDLSRRGVARMLMTLDAAPKNGTSRQGDVQLIKHPESALETADDTLLESLEGSIARIEEKLIELDDRVPRKDFQRRVLSGKHPRRLLARYGRLLASRRMPAGERRDRFEWLATELLTTRDAAGRRTPLSREAALPVLQHLIGGLQGRPDPTELREAIAYLREAREKLGRLTTHTEFFDGGFFLDVHGYKVSVRDQLLSPDFLYLSATLNAELDNRIEEWIAALEAKTKANQLTRGGPPRERIMALLREQEEAVDSIFGVRRRVHAPQAVGTPQTQPPRGARDERSTRERREPARRSGSAARTLVLLVLLAAIHAAGAFVAKSMHLIPGL